MRKVLDGIALAVLLIAGLAVVAGVVFLLVTDTAVGLVLVGLFVLLWALHRIDNNEGR